MIYLGGTGLPRCRPGTGARRAFIRETKCAGRWWEDGPRMASICSLMRTLLIALAIWAADTTIASAQLGADTLLNRFYALRASNPPAARAVLEQAAREFPRDLRVHLELGYFTLNAGDKGRALLAFRQAVEIAPGRADIWRQIGYIESDLGNLEASIAAFDRSLQIEPDNAQVRAQTAYLQDRLGRRRAATANFRIAMRAADQRIATDACRAYGNLRGLPDRFLPRPWFAEYYAAPEYRTHFPVGIIPFEGRVGLSFGDRTVVEPYGSLRITYDTRSGTTAFGPQIFFDNTIVPALGLRVRPLVELPFYVFVEGGAAFDLTDRDRAPWRGDIRGGLVGYYEWNTELACPLVDRFPLRPVADFYVDAVYYSRYGNFIAYGRARPGLRLFESEQITLDGYALIAGSTDSRGVKDNRQADIGGGISVRFYDLLGLTVRAEGVHVFRLGNSSYTDFRIRVEHTVRF
jgi:tetratricopeptide (TPR) repeat protein